MPQPSALADHDEVELKLTVLGPDPAATLAEIASLEHLSGLRVGSPTVHLIHDLYWDTPDRRLGERRLTVRLRTIDGDTRFTVKGGSTSDEGLFRRQELEVTATTDNWQAVMSELAREGIDLDNGGAGTVRDASDPATWLASAGLTVTQDRETERVARPLYRADRPVAELALDTTRYRFAGLVVEHREVEIEQLEPDAVSLPELRRALLTTMPGRLEPATMGKYSRGLEIERKLRAGDGAGEASRTAPRQSARRSRPG